jgi:hypothetical protein
MSLEAGRKYTVTAQKLVDSVHFLKKILSRQVSLEAGEKYTVTAQNLADSVHF